MKAKITGVVSTFVICAFFVACETPQIRTVQEDQPAGTEGVHPDYNKDRDEFIDGKFAVIASEFLDEYSGQYVVFDGTYLGHHDNVIIQRGREPVVLGDVMSANIASGTGMSASPQVAQVIWHIDDRDLGRPFLGAGSQAPVRIYAYVLPAGDRAQLEGRNASWGNVRIPLILLVEAVVNPD